MKLGEKIYVLRKRQGLSQEELASALNVSRQSISNWETGAANPEINKLALLAAKLGTSVDFLLDETQDIGDREQGSHDSGGGTEGTEGSEVHAEAGTRDQERATQAKSPQEGGPQVNNPQEGLAQAKKPKNSSYPDWLDNLPGLLKTGFYRYGWLFGIRLALYGLGFVIFGLIGKTMVGGFSRATASTGFGNFGNAIAITPDNLPREVVKQINDELGTAGGGYTDPGLSFMSIIPNAALIIGVILIITGLVLAYALKAWGKQQEEK
ncbi:MAG: helix-turn-helix transcriptional regulator [Eubacteriales bacterium]|nr:helix-turn-helix transcriptional regulator [Clostridiales bacterium]MDY5836733.1 helix-turn-helix transcriptional regulator [Eubacteriales bacterium]